MFVLANFKFLMRPQNHPDSPPILLLSETRSLCFRFSLVTLKINTHLHVVDRFVSLSNLYANSVWGNELKQQDSMVNCWIKNYNSDVYWVCIHQNIIFILWNGSRIYQCFQHPVKIVIQESRYSCPVYGNLLKNRLS